MNGKERVLKALRHEEGPVPVDFGAAPTTGIHCKVVEGLREYYGLEKRPVTVVEPYQMLGLIEDDLRKALGVDTDMMWNPTTMFGFANEKWKEWRAPWGQVVLVPEGFRTTVNSEKEVLIYPEGDLSARPSGKMPASGWFFDTIIRQRPIDENALDPADNLEEFQTISDRTLETLKVESARLRNCDRFVLANLGGTAIGDIGLVPGPGLKDPRGIRDITEWYMSTVARTDYLHEVFSRQVDIAIQNLELLLHSMDVKSIDAVYVCGTDFGTQRALFCSLDTFDSLYAPYYRRINDWIHTHTGWKTFKHSCGAIEPLLPRLADVGFDIINPVQCSAAGMSPEVLKDRHGASIVFWGGGVDTQKTLPFGTPQEVRREVLERCRVFSRGGGFVFNTIHNVLANTPIANFVAMIGAIKEFNGR